MAYVAQQQLDGYAEAVKHAQKRKEIFDRKVTKGNPGKVIFSIGQLVQIYRSDLDYTFKTEHKLLPKWSKPFCITGRILNSYTLESLNSEPTPGTFSARRLQDFTPEKGSKLVEDQRAIEKDLAKKAQTEQQHEKEAIDNKRSSEIGNMHPKCIQH